MVTVAAGAHPHLLAGRAAARAEAARIGGKAANLARLAAGGADVPAWFVVGSQAWEAHLAKVGGEGQAARKSLATLDAAGPDAPKVAAGAGAALAASVVAAPLDPSLREALPAALDALGPGPYAVRSSVVGEDSAAHSHAGQFASFLSLPGVQDVAEALVRCWASPFAAHALAYRLHAGLSPAPPGMGVIVQRMAEGSVSGVLFTADPVTGQRDRMRLSACWGLGEGLVSGLCEADEWVCTQEGAEESLRVATKDVHVVPDPQGGGTRERPVPPERQSVRCLTPAEVAAICAEGARIAKAFGEPQDIEWTLEGGAFRVLQARPITSLPPQGPRTVWDNSNIQESFCGVTTPLTFSFAVEGYASVYEQTMRAVSLPEDVIVAHRPMLQELLGLVRGRIYYNIGNWYRGLLLLPSFGRNKADMEAMMGLQEPVDLIEDQVLTTAEKLRRLPRLALTFLRLQRRFARLDRDAAAFLARFDAACARFDRKALADAELPELMAALDALRRDLRDQWSVPILNDFRVMMASGRLRRMVTARAGEAAELRLQQLMMGIEGMESVEPTRRLMAIAALARRNPALQATLRDGEPAEALRALQTRHPAIAADLTAFLERYGDRCMGELKLETVSFREDPTPLLRMLRALLDSPVDAEAIAARQRAQREAAEAQLLAGAGWWERRRLLRTLKAARDGVRVRENTRLARTRMFGLYRHVYRAIGRRLAEQGRLDHPEDVFYLTTGDIEADQRAAPGAQADLAALARRRRAEFAAFEEEVVPHRVETHGPASLYRPPSTPAPQVAVAGRVLRGIGCCAGVVEAPLHIVHGPDDDLHVSGRILTALRTDPGWAPLFPAAVGILVERGSTLSHSAVLARELGIPAVVGVPGLLDTVRQGERVRLDGGRGTVERLEVPE